MSRIHEALKKAAQERSAKLAAEAEPNFLEVVDAPRTAIPLREIEQAPVNRVAVADEPGFLRFDDLAAKCAKPKWRIDPRMSVFEGDGGSYVGAERFRTLRSRLYQIAATRPLRTIVVT